jgi:hypothetical protein
VVVSLRIFSQKILNPKHKRTIYETTRDVIGNSDDDDDEDVVVVKVEKRLLRLQQRFGVASASQNAQRERVGETRETRNIINDARRKRRRRGRETPYVFDGTDAKRQLSDGRRALFERGFGGKDEKRAVTGAR